MKKIFAIVFVSMMVTACQMPTLTWQKEPETIDRFDWVPHFSTQEGNLELKPVQAQMLAQTVIMNSPEYKSGGMNIKEIDAVKLDCWECYDYWFEFEKKVSVLESTETITEKIQMKVEIRNGILSSLEKDTWTQTEPNEKKEGDASANPESVSQESEKKISKGPELIELLPEKCTQEKDCRLPSKYAPKSDCPYEVACVQSRCMVICPFALSDQNTTKIPSTERIPEFCTREYMPVCGQVNGLWKTFSNRCEALRVKSTEIQIGRCSENLLQKNNVPESELCRVTLLKTEDPKKDDCFELCCDKSGKERLDCNEKCIK